MAYTYQPPNGFPMWEDVGNDPSIVLSAALTSSSNLGGGTIAGSGSGSVTYTDNGILLGTTAAINWANHASMTAAMKTKLLGGFTLTCWIESGFLPKAYTGGGSGEHVLCCNGGTIWALWKGSAANYIAGRQGASTSANGTFISAAGKGTHTRLDMSYSGDGYTTYYVDYMPVITWQKTAPSTPFANHVGIGRDATSFAPISHRVKNFMLTSRPITMAVNPTFGHIAMFGHSFAYYGDYPTNAAYYTVSGDANSGDGSGNDTGTTAMEGGCSPTIHRMLTSRGIAIPEGKIRNYAVAGTTVSQIETQITTATANGKNLKIALIQSGINEVTNSANSFAADYPTWTTTWQTQIDALVAAGCTHILIGNVTSPLNDGVHTANIYRTRTEDANTLIDTVISSNSSTCYKVDLFNTLGGHSYNPNDLGASSLHPSAYGHNKIGRAFANKLLELL